MTGVDQPQHNASLVRVPHPELSLWQSAVTEVLAEHLSGGDLTAPVVRTHPLARAADAHTRELLTAAQSGGVAAPQQHPRFKAILELAHRVHLTGIEARVESIIEAARAYSNEDPRFLLECIPKFIEWYLAGQRPQYRDWTVQGGGDIDFGLVEQRVPADARIAVIGDWGTGMDDARALLKGLLAECRPTLLVHLGDIYYSGTQRESACNFADVLSEAFHDVPPRIPVFNLPGNHDYYSGGDGFYSLLDTLNPGDARQPASYFCLRSADDRWQLVGVDTGFNDRVPGISFDPFYTAPRLHDSEVAWVRHKLERFAGRTLLFSHHQLFSAHAALNGPRSGRQRLNFNDGLYEAVRPHLDQIAIWMWGHEHSLAIFEDGVDGLEKGRLVGCSAFEMGAGDDPYAVKFEDAPYRQPVIKLSMQGGWYSHGFAVIDMAGAAVEYYQFPSWAGGSPATLGRLELLYRERLNIG